MRLGQLISHKTLNRLVYLARIDENDNVIVIDQKTKEYGMLDQEFYPRYSHNLTTGIITEVGRCESSQGTRKDLADKTQAKPLTVLLVSRLLDESVDSKQIFQALKSEGINLEGSKIEKNYLGKWKYYDSEGNEFPINYLIDIIESYDIR